ncbi:MAG TPA: ABC transporter permease DevC [Candidatus Obscuribacter sp.]|nr:ABC transporter permease DevC [Candidatus Obscuribacter sp.]HND69425.1 ABC transporter permease DevC [Candidatus Obscuribacter sp.]
MHLPLAWLQLIKNKSRFLVAVCGIAFACILIFVEMGFEQSLYVGCTKPHKAMEGDLFLVSPSYQTFYGIKSFSRRKLYQALAVPGVETINSVRIGKGTMKNPENKLFRDILIFGVDPDYPGLKLDSAAADLVSLKQVGNVLFDRASRPEFGPIETVLKTKQHCTIEVNKLRLKSTGLFTMGASFAADGNLLTSDITLLKLEPKRSPDEIEVGLIKSGSAIAGDTDKLERLRQQVQSYLGSSVQVLNGPTFAEREKTYWAGSTGVGFIFGLGVLVGFIVGVVIVYQVLSSDVVDHLPEYATLKAMGYSDRYLFGIIMQEALILSVAGFLPGVLASAGIYEIAHAATLYPLSMTPERIALVFVMTFLMCAISGFIAARKLHSADPAELF